MANFTYVCEDLWLQQHFLQARVDELVSLLNGAGATTVPLSVHHLHCGS